MQAAHWSINGRFLSQNLSGVQRYAQEIVRALDRLLDETSGQESVRVTLVCPPGSREIGLTRIVQTMAGKSTGHLWEQAVLPLHVKDGLLSLGNTGPLATKKQIVCIHDLNTRLYPESYSRAFKLSYGLLLPALGKRAAAITTVSRFSATQLAHFGLVSGPVAAVIPNGHEHALAWAPQHSDKTARAAGPDTIVMIGSHAPHKNLALMLRLAPALAKSGMKIALAGSLDNRVFAASSSANAIQRADNVIWLGRVSNEELAALLRDSLCLAFPSYTEGFGLPALEAMALGCPVVVSNQASIPEVCGDSALYASPDDDQTWLQHFERLHRDGGLRKQLAQRGRAQAQNFSCRRSGQLYLDLMTKLDAQTPRM